MNPLRKDAMTTTTGNSTLWTAANRANWDDRASAHLAGGGDFYDLAGVKAGQSSLLPLELELAGEVAGCRLLHLMCHLGLDSISWARLGAQVTAVDLSPVAIAAARRLATEVNVHVDFHTSDIYAFLEVCTGRFAVMVMTYGVLCWLRDLSGLMRLVAERLETGGRFVLVDGHPLTNLWPCNSVLGGLSPGDNSYFAKSSPDCCERQRSYGGEGRLSNPTSYQWQHHPAEIVQAVIDAGLRLRTIREEPYGFYRRYPGMARRPDGYLDPPHGAPKLPLLLALMAERT
jgi:SAM-dependent methyltransferase